MTEMMPADGDDGRVVAMVKQPQTRSSMSDFDASIGKFPDQQV
jgi:hypothetical protein